MFLTHRSPLCSLTLLAVLTALSTLSIARAAEPPAVRAEMLVSADWLAGHLEDPNVVILHAAAEQADYESGHISGARFDSWKELTATRDRSINELPPVAAVQKLFERLGVGETARIVL